MQQFGQAFSEDNLTFNRIDRNAQAGGLFAKIGRPSASGIDQRLAVKRTLFGSLHGTDPRPLMQHTCDIGVVEQVYAILSCRFHIRVGQAERTDLMIAKKLQGPACQITDSWLRLTQSVLIEPAHLLGQVWNLRNDVLGVELVFVVVDHILETRALELEVHTVAIDQLTMQLWIKCIRLQGKVEE
ncbi:hypothetical protein D3C77_407720 [compost metagenome]